MLQANAGARDIRTRVNPHAWSLNAHVARAAIEVGELLSDVQFLEHRLLLSVPPLNGFCGSAFVISSDVPNLV
jgi:hypothetical protein